MVDLDAHLSSFAVARSIYQERYPACRGHGDCGGSARSMGVAVDRSSPGAGGAAVSRSEEEFTTGASLTVDGALEAYHARGLATDETVRSLPLSRCAPVDSWAEGRDLRFALLHLINETARHAGHADSTRELLDGMTGE